MATQDTGTTASSTTNLNHVYFFVNATASETTRTHDEASTDISGRSRASSPGSTGTDNSDGTLNGSSSTTSSKFNPDAPEFSPNKALKRKTKKVKAVPSSPTSAPLYKIQQLPGKGQGLVATALIPRGTRILAEKPLIQIPGLHVSLVWSPYCRLSDQQKAVYDKLHGFTADPECLESSVRMSLVMSGDELEVEEMDRLVDEQVRVMSIFGVNNFNANGGLAVYPTTARINHSCVPNAFHGFNPNIKRFTIHAVRDIAPGEEITISYMGSPATFMIRSQRIEYLRSCYGFTCTCASCSDKTGTADSRREILGAICGGLAEYEHAAAPAYPYIANGPAQAFDLAANAVKFLHDEGLLTMEYLRALHAASRYALTLGDWHTAYQYALQEGDVQQTILGKEVEDLVRAGNAASCWIKHVRDVIFAALGAKEARSLFSEYEMKDTPPKPGATSPKKKKALAGKRAMKESDRLKQANKEDHREAAERRVEGRKDSTVVSPSKPEGERVEPVAKIGAKPPPPSTWAKVAAIGAALKGPQQAPGRKNEKGKQRAE